MIYFSFGIFMESGVFVSPAAVENLILHDEEYEMGWKDGDVSQSGFFSAVPLFQSPKAQAFGVSFIHLEQWKYSNFRLGYQTE